VLLFKFIKIGQPMASSSSSLKSPTQRLIALLAQDKKDLAILLLYTLFSSLFTLSMPLASQALINTIASGFFLQPLIVLTSLVLGGLLFAGFIRVIELWLVEILQQRLFVTVALRLAEHLPKVNLDALIESYAPELVNRYFDLMTVQKSLAKLLLTVPSSVVQMLLCMTIMALYSPYFLLFGVFITLALGIMLLLGKNAVQESLTESKYKYKLAAWLEDVARCQVGFKLNANPLFSLQKADALAGNYVQARKKHFSILLRQLSWEFIVSAFALAGVLALGGWLVIQAKLSLGQLIAAELMAILTLAAVDKLVLSLETYYDLLTGLDKLGVLEDLPEEASGVQPLVAMPLGAGVSMTLKNVKFSYGQNVPLFEKFNLLIPAHSRYAIIGPSGSGKTTLADLLLGLLTPKSGSIAINQQDLRDIDVWQFRNACACVDAPNSIFSGTLLENILMGREASHTDIDWALEQSGVSYWLNKLPYGLNTLLVSEGTNLSQGKRQMVLLARAILERPSLLVLDEAFHAIDRNIRQKILTTLFDKTLPWTIVAITHDAEILALCDEVVMLDEGRCVFQAATHALKTLPLKNLPPLFLTLFPRVRDSASTSSVEEG
jgi:ABC-type bacteriocin/lantibiotic exporter with double-glycine peptidase domain